MIIGMIWDDYTDHLPVEITASLSKMEKAKDVGKQPRQKT